MYMARMYFLLLQAHAGGQLPQEKASLQTDIQALDFAAQKNSKHGVRDVCGMTSCCDLYDGGTVGVATGCVWKREREREMIMLLPCIADNILWRMDVDAAVEVKNQDVVAQVVCGCYAAVGNNLPRHHLLVLHFCHGAQRC